ncbi:undecaprenyl-phosphate alpha-N-acetylglucosaminyl 1-phosphate transferase [Caminicella sporogenes]|nr:undecaprenyl-phosphate alpha-N-acetylglucosaminyl 1-phosphate transferase [Caminicella sporogenes]
MIVAAMVSLVTTPLVKKLAYKLGAIDIPKDDRRIHKTPIPRLGGLAIYLGFLISVLIFLEVDRAIAGMIIGASIIIITGIIDDLNPLPPKVKLTLQIISALVLVKFGVKIDFISNFFKSGKVIDLKILSIPITIFWIVGITNTVNLIDGLDGLAAGISSIVAITLAYIAYVNQSIIPNAGETAILTLIVAGACIGFLPYNFNPAKIFMGDTGSLFLGFILAAISINGSIKGATTLAIVVPILALGLPIFDTAFAILRRVYNGRPIMEADKGHLHHRLLSIGLCQRRAVLILYLISSMLGLSAAFLLNRRYMDSIIILAITAIAVVVPINQTWNGKRN